MSANTNQFSLFRQAESSASGSTDLNLASRKIREVNLIINSIPVTGKTVDLTYVMKKILNKEDSAFRGESGSAVLDFIQSNTIRLSQKMDFKKITPQMIEEMKVIFDAVESPSQTEAGMLGDLDSISTNRSPASRARFVKRVQKIAISAAFGGSESSDQYIRAGKNAILALQKIRSIVQNKDSGSRMKSVISIYKEFLKGESDSITDTYSFYEFVSLLESNRIPRIDLVVTSDQICRIIGVSFDPNFKMPLSSNLRDQYGLKCSNGMIKIVLSFYEGRPSAQEYGVFLALCRSALQPSASQETSLPSSALLELEGRIAPADASPILESGEQAAVASADAPFSAVAGEAVAASADAPFSAGSEEAVDASFEAGSGEMAVDDLADTPSISLRSVPRTRKASSEAGVSTEVLSRLRSRTQIRQVVADRVVTQASRTRARARRSGTRGGSEAGVGNESISSRLRSRIQTSQVVRAGRVVTQASRTRAEETAETLRLEEGAVATLERLASMPVRLEREGLAFAAASGLLALGSGEAVAASADAPSSAGAGEAVAASAGAPFSAGSEEAVAASADAPFSAGSEEAVAASADAPSSAGAGEAVAASADAPFSAGSGEAVAASADAPSSAGAGEAVAASAHASSVLGVGAYPLSGVSLFAPAVPPVEEMTLDELIAAMLSNVGSGEAAVAASADASSVLGAGAYPLLSGVSLFAPAAAPTLFAPAAAPNNNSAPAQRMGLDQLATVLSDIFSREAAAASSAASSVLGAGVYPLSGVSFFPPAAPPTSLFNIASGLAGMPLSSGGSSLDSASGVLNDPSSVGMGPPVASNTSLAFAAGVQLPGSIAELDDVNADIASGRDPVE